MQPTCDNSSLSPQEHLFRERRMFESVESGGDGQFAIWEASRPAVVLGHSNRVEEWVHIDACRRDSVDILRRSSGGGAVVVGPGCVNYAIAVPAVSHPQLSNVAASFRIVLQHVADAFESDLRLAGLTDLVRAGRKVSGNAQRRGRRALLLHGTVLYAFDAELALRYLTEPPRQPLYRAGRTHDAFLGNLHTSREETMARVRDACELLVLRWPDVALE